MVDVIACQRNIDLAGIAQLVTNIDVSLLQQKNMVSISDVLEGTKKNPTRSPPPPKKKQINSKLNQ